jgi:hypothetical protein
MQCSTITQENTLTNIQYQHDIGTYQLPFKDQKDIPILNYANMTLWTTIPGSKTRGRFSFSMRNGNPRISVGYEDSDGKSHFSTVGFDPITFEVFLKEFEQVIEGPSGVKSSFDNRRLRDGAWVTINKLYFGKDEEGKVWIGLSAEGLINLRFVFEGSRYHDYQKNGRGNRAKSKKTPLGNVQRSK